MGFNKLLPLVGQFLFVGVFYEPVHHIPSHRPVFLFMSVLTRYVVHFDSIHVCVTANTSVFMSAACMSMHVCVSWGGDCNKQDLLLYTYVHVT